MTETSAALDEQAMKSSAPGENGAPLVLPVSRAIAWWTVALLTSLYVFSSLDRLILVLLVGPIKEAFGVSDTQIGLLFGPAFALFYAIMGLPMARIADRGNRHLLITAAVVIWALCTIGTGLATAFSMLVVLRIGLAIAEAALSPAAHSMIGDMFAPEKRVFAASVYTGIGQAGGTGSGLIGGAVLILTAYLIQSGVIPAIAEWRVAFFVAGVPPLVLGLIFALTLREPVRRTAGAHVASLRDVFALMLRNARLYLAMFAACGFVQVIIYAFLAWTPELLQRQYDWSRTDAALGFGFVNVIGVVAGTFLTPMLSQALARAGRLDGMLLGSLAAASTGIAAALLATWVASPIAFLAAYAVSIAGLLGSSNNILIANQIIAPDRMRGTMVALFIMTTTIIGQSLGPPLVPLLVGILPFAEGTLAGGLMVTSALATLPAIALLLLARKPFRAMAARGWVHAAEND